MSMSRPAGIVLPGYNPLKVANAPTIGAATQASATSVSVTFTAPSCVGGGAISSYTAFANCGLLTASGASSPLTVTGLTTGTAYTFKVIATNAFGPSYPSAASNSVTPVAQGQDAYTAAGTYTWVAPAGVTSASVVAVGGGGGGGGGTSCCGGRGAGGGALRYVNNISVTPGSSYAVVVGAGGTGRSSGNKSPTNGSASSFNTSTVVANGASGQTGGSGGTGTGGNGGSGGNCGFYCGGGGGGAGGYSGNGGAANRYPSQASAGSGGGGGGGTSIGGGQGYGGGGVGILGQGCSGAGGTSGQGGFPQDPTGKGGSGGANGANRTGGAYGAGGGAGGLTQNGGVGGVGAVRIIYPGTTRSFPSTNTGDL